jgi:prefoldin subunit 5
MVETPKLSSLASELLKFFLLSSFLFGLVLAFVFFFLGGVNAYYSLGAGFAIALAWVLFNILWTKGKLEELFGRLLYVIDILEEQHKEKTVVPIPLHEEMLGIVDSIRELIKNLEEKYTKELKEAEEQLETISENSAKIIEALEKIHEGHMRVEFPSGLDPVGAIGQAFAQAFDIYREKIRNLKAYVSECGEALRELAVVLEEDPGKIDINKVKEGLRRVMETQEKIEKELRFFKDV